MIGITFGKGGKGGGGHIPKGGVFAQMASVRGRFESAAERRHASDAQMRKGKKIAEIKFGEGLPPFIKWRQGSGETYLTNQAGHPVRLFSRPGQPLEFQTSVNGRLFIDPKEGHVTEAGGGSFTISFNVAAGGQIPTGSILCKMKGSGEFSEVVKSRGLKEILETIIKGGKPLISDSAEIFVR